MIFEGANINVSPTLKITPILKVSKSHFPKIKKDKIKFLRYPLDSDNEPHHDHGEAFNIG